VAAATKTKVATSTTPSTATSAGGVLGATKTLSSKPSTSRRPAARGGVLGTTTPLHSSVSAGRLPFTGLPLWPFAAGAAGMLLLGAYMRRSASNRI
jgi:hypothetical protein